MYRDVSKKSNQMQGSTDSLIKESKNTDISDSKIQAKNLSLTATMIGQKMPSMPKNYIGQEQSGIEIEQMTLDTLRDNFIKFLPENAPGA